MLTIETKSLKVGRFVDTEHVNTVIRTYKQERWVHNSERIGKEDSMSVWYSVEEMEELLERVKLHGGDGLKFYFAAYPENYEHRPEYAGRQTIVMVGTKQKAEGASGVLNKDLYISTEKGSEILAYNAGSICPPSCNGTGKGGGGSLGVDADDWGGIGITLVDRGDKGLTIV